MKHAAILILASLCCCLKLSAQLAAEQEPALSWEEFAEVYLNNSNSYDADAEGATYDELERLEEIYQHPLQLNRCTRRQLLELPFLTEAQTDSLIAYRERKHGLLSLGELQLIQGFDYFTRYYLTLFARCDSACLPTKEQLERHRAEQRLSYLLSQGKHEAESRLDIPLYRRQGFDKPENPTRTNYFTGNAMHHIVRYRYNLRREAAYGLTLEKDAGEPVGKRGFYPYGYLSGYLLLRPRSRKWSMAIGDYELRGGRGLLLGRPTFGGLSQLVQPFKAVPINFHPHTSVNEAEFFRGAAAAYKWQNIGMLAFVSYRRLDGRQEPGTDTIRTWLKTGLHRTISEIDNRRNLGCLTAGTQVNWQATKGGIALSGYVSHFGLPIYPEERYYNRYYFRGQTAGGAALFYYVTYKWLHLQGELATDASCNIATEHIVSARFSPRLLLNLQVRHFSPRFVSLYGHALQQGSRVSNEQGIALGMRCLPHPDWELTGYVDIFRFQTPTYTAILPGSKGIEASIQSKWKLSGPWQLILHYRLKTKQRTVSGYRLLEYRNTHKLRLGSLLNLKHFGLTAQADLTYATRQTGKHSVGWMASVRPIWKASKRYQLKGFAGLFFTDDYESALYAYEPQLYRASAFPSFAYHGMRGVVVSNWHITPALLLGLRLGSTCYFNRSSISSGISAIHSSWKNDLSVQLRWRI